MTSMHPLEKTIRDADTGARFQDPKIFSFLVSHIFNRPAAYPFEPDRILEPFVVLVKALCKGRVVASSPNSCPSAFFDRQ